jgi:Asp-tRNA(Asn)/Glu-tRNA(Gln) amidotransferase A subunit family amidase
MRVGFARHLRRYYEEGKDKLSPVIIDAIEEGRETRATAYLEALELREALYQAVERLLHHYDSILTPAAPGEAPLGLESTGSPAFNAIWTFLGMPAVSLPLMEGPNGMPLGVQLVGRRGFDGRLLRTASWLVRELAAEEAQQEAAAGP